MATAKRRAAAKGWATRAKNALSELLGTKDISKVALEEAISDVDKRLHALELVQSEFEIELDEQDIDEEISTAHAFLADIKKVRLAGVQLLQEFKCLEAGEAAASVADDSSSSSSEGARHKVEAKLPKLTLPKFSGDPLKWTPFWDQFLVMIDNTELPAISKFSYLRSVGEGDAAEAISGLALSDGNYEEACDILEERFGRPELVKFSHIQELLNLKPLSKQVSVQELRKLHNNLLSHVRSLANLGIGGDKYGIFLTPMILSCLPHAIRMEWAKVSAEKEGDLKFLLEFMTKEIENRERCNTFKGLLRSEAKVVKDGPVKSTATALSSVSCCMIFWLR